MLRAEMTRRGITYDQLAAKLAELGVKDTPSCAVHRCAGLFFVQCLSARDARRITET